MSFLTINASAPAMGSLLTAYFLKNNQAIEIKIGSDNSLKLNSSGIILDSDASICRFLARSHSQMKYYGTTFLESVAIENWITFSIGPLSCSLKFLQSLEYLDQALYSISFLVGHQITIADFFVWGTLFCNQCWLKILENNNDYKNIIRWFHHIKSYIEVNNALNILQEYSDSKYISTKKVKSQDAGKFIDLPGAKKNEVVVRFPPEASGYLHIGHAKAALLNQYYKDYFGGKLIMRFDDTNPVKEKLNFEKVILEDLKLLKIHPDKFSYTSDYFDLLLELCEKLIKEGKAYVDDTDPEIMKQEREKRKVSKSRNNTLHDNLNLWKQMLEGTEYGQKCCVRAKIDMENDNGCLRDPTIYRCKGESHPRTGNKYKVYPTYDFACPIVDSVEGVTHALRTMEYHDRDEQYYWFIAALKLRKPIIWEYSRLNMMNTVLSKRKLSWFVEEKIVDSWEDPRLPTVRGLIRRGLTVEGLKQFIIAQGSSRSVVQMEWDKIWAFNKKVIDPVASRYTAIRRDKTVIVNVKNAKEELLTINKHPKNLSAGTRKIPIGSKLLIELNDALQLREGENATFINWGNLKINKIYRNGCNSITSIDAETNLNDLDFKKTLKLTWLTDSKNLTPVEAHFFSDIISKPVLGKDEDFKKYVNYNSKRIIEYLGDEDLKTLVVGDIIQLQRIGFFRCDSTFQSSGCVILIHIPDGSSKIDLVNNEKSITSKKSLEENSVDVEKLENRGSVADSKYMPISHQELEQIAIQWRKGREITENGQTKAILVKKKSHSKKITSKPSNCDGEKNMKNDGKQSKSRLGLEVSKTKNFAEWYSQVITKGELIEYYDVSGCYVLRPWSFALWESIQKFLDEKIKSFGVQNCYFPIFLTKSVLEKEKSHLTDFAPEVAWVTKSGESDLAEHIAIRPTSETVMYPAFSKWIQSYRDLPIKLNQWSNVVRWEFKHPQPFLRTREFLWQEGHTAFATSKEAETEVYQVLDLYSKVYTGLLAVPVIKGWKTPKEKFAGSDYTTTLEAFISGSGRGIQGATSHYLGQNFSKMFDISYEDPETKEKKFVYQNSWGMTTRTIGIMIMVHSDDKGLILPPRVASIQVVIVACGITVNLQEEEKKTLINFCKNLESDFIYSGIRAKFDNRENYSPGWKFNHWELKGVPLRVEIGPNDLKKEEVVAVRRDTGEKINFKVKDINEKLKKLLEDVQENLFQKATNELNNSIIKLKTWNGFCEALDDKKIILAPFCEMESCEDNIKKDSARSLDIEPGAPSMGAKSLCIPFEQPVDISEADQCIHPMCKNKPRRYTLFGRSY